MGECIARRSSGGGPHRHVALALVLAATFLGASSGHVAGAPTRLGVAIPQHYRFHVGQDTPAAGDVQPTALAVGHDDSLYAIDGKLGRVLRYNHDGALVGVWGAPGSGPGEFGDGCGQPGPELGRIGMRWCGPSDVAVGPDGNVWVLDPFNGRVQRFTPWGAFLDAACILGRAEDRPDTCALAVPLVAWTLAVGPDGTLFVSIPERNEVRAIRPDGTIDATWSLLAGDLAVDASGQLFASEPRSSRLVALDREGARVREVKTFPVCYRSLTSGRWAFDIPHPCNPIALTIDPHQHVVVTRWESGIRLIQRLADDGAVLSQMDYGEPGDFGVALAVGLDDRVYLGTRSRILAYSPSGTPLVGAWGMPPIRQGSAGVNASLSMPSAVQEVGNERVVADTGNQRLLWLDDQGSPIRNAAAPGAGQESLRPVVALAAAPDGGIVVAERGGVGGRHVTPSGNVDLTWGRIPDGAAEFGRLTSVVANDDGSLVVADSMSARILLFDAIGRAVGYEPIEPPHVSTGGDWGTIELTRSADGSIWAVGRSSRRVAHLAPDGRWLGGWPLTDDVGSPRGIAAGADDMVWIADAVHNRIARFSPDGRAHDWFGDPNALIGLSGVAVMPDGRLVVTAADPPLPRTNGRRLLVLSSIGEVLEAIDPHFEGIWRYNPTDVRADRGRLLLTGNGKSQICAGTGCRDFPGPAVVELDANLQVVARLAAGDGVEGSNWGESSGMAALPEGGTVAVTAPDSRFVRFAPDGSTARVWRSRRSGPGSIDAPSGVAVTTGTNGASHVFVADAISHRIARFAWDGTFEHEWFAGPDGIPLWAPHQLAAAPDGTLWVADTNNHRLAHFTAEGTPIGVLGGRAPSTWLGFFNAPEGVAVLPDGTVIVADTGNRRLQAFAPDGTFLAAWRGDGPPGTALRRPSGLSIADDGTLWVADREADRVVVFGPAPEIGWHVRYYRDDGLLDGPVAAQWIPGRHLDLDWQGQPPAPGLGATGFSLRAERRAGSPLAGASSTQRRLSLAVRGGMTFIAPHGQPPVVLAGDAAMAAAAATTTVRRGIDADVDWLRVDFVARGDGPMIRVVETRDDVLVMPFAGR